MFSRLNKYKLETFLGQTPPTYACIRSQLSAVIRHNCITKFLFIQIWINLKKMVIGIPFAHPKSQERQNNMVTFGTDPTEGMGVF